MRGRPCSFRAGASPCAAPPGSVSTGTKVLWILLVLILPLIGLIIWYFAGPKSASG